MKHIQEGIYQSVHLRNGHELEVLVDKEELELVELRGYLQAFDDCIHCLSREVSGTQVFQVHHHPDLE